MCVVWISLEDYDDCVLLGHVVLEGLERTTILFGGNVGGIVRSKSIFVLFGQKIDVSLAHRRVVWLK